MGWWINLFDPDEPEMTRLPLEISGLHQGGGVITIGGSNQASMSVTYNYSKYYYDTIDKEDGFRWLNGKLAKDTIVRLENAITELGTDFSGDYWEATEGNAGRILQSLVKWAHELPNAVWGVS